MVKWTVEVEAGLAMCGLLAQVHRAGDVTRDRMKSFYTDQLVQLGKIDSATLDQQGKIDIALLEDLSKHELRQLDVNDAYGKQTDPITSPADAILDFELARRRMEPIDPANTANRLTELGKQLDRARTSFDAGLASGKLVITNGVDPAPATAER